MPRFLLVFAPLLLGACATSHLVEGPAPAQLAAVPVTGGVAAANDPRAGAIGEDILRRGGSATDSAVAMLFALSVIEPQSTGLGGGGLWVHGASDGTVETLDGREAAPAAATGRWFLGEDGRPVNRTAATLSGLSIGVPGNVALAAEAHRRHGKLPWAELLAPAIALARDGFAVTPRLSGSLAAFPQRAGRDQDGRDMFYPGGRAPGAGTVIRLPELADTLQRIADAGPQAFYSGAFAQGLAAEIAADTPRAEGMTAADLAGYRVEPREPACTEYRRHTVCTMGPPSSGGYALLAILEQLERFDLAAHGVRSPVAWHLFLEAQRLAYADREFYIADPRFVAVPLAGLLDPDYLAARSALIDAETTIAAVAPGQPSGTATPLARAESWPEQGTTHFVAVDATGDMVSVGSTVEGAFGSGLAYRGFYLNNELTDFSFVPERGGAPVANGVEGGKRPASSMTPTVVYGPDGAALFAVGAAGGGLIPVQTARAVVAVIDFGLPLDEALGLPFVMATGDGGVLAEKGTWMEALAPEFLRLGHPRVTPFDQLLRTTGALRTAQGWRAAHDPRLIPLVTIPAVPEESPAMDAGFSEG